MSLIAARESVQDAVNAVAKSDMPEVVESELETVAIFCERPQTWDFFVSAAGYLDELGEENALSVNEIIDRINEDSVRAVYYFDNVVHLPVETILLGGREAALQIEEDQKLKIIPLVSSLSYCRAKCGKNLKCLEEFLANWEGQDSGSFGRLFIVGLALGSLLVGSAWFLLRSFK
jgi:hypothetical protein